MKKQVKKAAIKKLDVKKTKAVKGGGYYSFSS